MRNKKGVMVQVASDGTRKGFVRDGEDGPPRALEDEDLEAVVGGYTYAISFDCCTNTYYAFGASYSDAVSSAAEMHAWGDPSHPVGNAT